MKQKLFLRLLLTLLALCLALPNSTWVMALETERHSVEQIQERGSSAVTTASANGAIGNLIGTYTKSGSKITLQAQNGVMTLNFCKNNMVRVRIAPTEADFLADNPNLQAVKKFDNDYTEVPLTLNETANDLEISTENLTVSVNKSTLALTYKEKSGAVIAKNTVTNPTGFEGESKWVNFQRDANGTEEHFYGLGAAPTNGFNTVDWRNRTYDLWMLDTGVHAITPLYYSTAGYGIYLNNSNKGSISFRSTCSIEVEGGELDYYFIYGPSFQNIQSDFGELCGTIAMPPLSSLGLTYRGALNFTDQQLITAIEDFQKAGIAVDTVGVEPGWQTATYPCTYVWSNKFPNPATFIESIHNLGVKVNLWEHPFISEKSPVYNQILPYSLTSNTLSVNAEDKNYGFEGLVPDFTLPQAKEIYWNIHKENLASIGVDGFKIDETDSWVCGSELDITFPGGLSANAYHNIMGTLTVNNMAERYKTEYNKRIFTFSRGNYTGMQRYATTAYSDTYGFSQYLMTVIAQSYAGTYFTPEVRGASTSNDIDYMRRTQMMFMTPFAMNNEWIDGQDVLDRSQAVIDNYKKYNHLYYALIPYKYSLFWQQHTKGLSVIRALPMEFQEDQETYSVKNQFLLGDSILVAPVNSTNPKAVRNVYFPAGADWVDYETGYVYKGGQTIRYTANADVLPLFIRKGAIIPTGAVGNNTSDKRDTTIAYDLYPSNTQTHFTLYEDDGESYDYEKGKYATTELSLKKSANTITFTASQRTNGYQIANRTAIAKVHYRTKPYAVTLNGTNLEQVASFDEFESATGNVWFYNSGEKDSEKIVYVKYNDTGKTQTVTLNVGEEPEQILPGETPSTAARFECEDTGNKFRGTTTKSLASASGEKIVANVGNDGRNHFTMNITMEEDGVYPVDIAFANGDQLRTCYLEVNQEEGRKFYFYSTGGFDRVSTICTNLPLKKGTNTLRFYTLKGEGWAPDFDYIDVYADSPVQQTTGGIYRLPSQGTAIGTFVEENPFAMEKQAINGLAGETKQFQFNGVFSQKNQPGEVTLCYANTGDKNGSLTITVNGQSKVLYLPPTHSPHQFGRVSVAMDFVTGENTVTLTGDIQTDCDNTGVTVEAIMVPSIGFTDTPFPYGDVNQDTKIDAKDALQVLKYAVDKIDLTEIQKKAANVNKDDAINAKDALEILKKSVNKPACF